MLGFGLRSRLGKDRDLSRDLEFWYGVCTKYGIITLFRRTRLLLGPSLYNESQIE